MDLIIDVILISLNVTNVCLHGIGIYLLVCLQKVGEPSIQNMFILNLSVSELLMNATEILRRCFLLILLDSLRSSTIEKIKHYLSIIMFTGISVVFYMNMVYITLDRLLHIALNIRYRVYWSTAKAKCLLQITWIVGMLTCLCISIVDVFTNFKWEPLFYIYFYPIMEFAFVLLAVTTYFFIFQKYKKSYRVSSQRTKNVPTDKKAESSFRIFQKSRFFVPVLLILTFIIFMLIPDLIYLFVGVIKKNKSDILLASCWISYAVSNAVDACIYIFMQDPVKKLLWKKVRRLLELVFNIREYEQNEDELLTLTPICRVDINPNMPC